MVRMHDADMADPTKEEALEFLRDFKRRAKSFVRASNLISEQTGLTLGPEGLRKAIVSGRLGEESMAVAVALMRKDAARGPVTEAPVRVVERDRHAHPHVEIALAQAVASEEWTEKEAAAAKVALGYFHGTPSDADIEQALKDARAGAKKWRQLAENQAAQLEALRKKPHAK